MADLILVPTPLELEVLRASLVQDSAVTEFAFQLCGFGPITAAARAGSLIARYQPDRVLLIGTAGAFDTDRFAIGSSHRFDEVACDGIGVGWGDSYQSASELGWDQFTAEDACPRVGDVLPLVSTYVSDMPCAGQLLSVCAATSSLQEAESRQQRFPKAVAEDMEGFAVAAACTLAGVPLQIVRGIANRVGDRDKSNWTIDAALHSAAELASQLLTRNWIPAST